MRAVEGILRLARQKPGAGVYTQDGPSVFMNVVDVSCNLNVPVVREFQKPTDWGQCTGMLGEMGGPGQQQLQIFRYDAKRNDLLCICSCNFPLLRRTIIGAPFLSIHTIQRDTYIGKPRTAAREESCHSSKAIIGDHLILIRERSNHDKELLAGRIEEPDETKGIRMH